MQSEFEKTFKQHKDALTAELSKLVKQRQVQLAEWDIEQNKSDYEFYFTAGWQAAKAQSMSEWISVEDELPTPNKTLSDAVIAWDGLCIRRIPLCLFKPASEVTHWMPIPQPPKAQEPANESE